MARSMRVYSEVDLPADPALLPNNLVVHRDGEYLSYATPTSIVTVQTSNGVPCFPMFQLPSGTTVVSLSGVTDARVANIIVAAALSDRTVLLLVNGLVAQTIDGKVCNAPAGFSCVAAAAVTNSDHIVVALGGHEGLSQVRPYGMNGQILRTPPMTLAVMAHERRRVSSIDVLAQHSAMTAEVLSADANGRVVLWKDGTPACVVEVTDARDSVVAVKLCPTIDQFAVACGCGKIKIFSRAAGEPLLVINAHSRWVNALSCHASSAFFLSAAEDGQLYVWKTAQMAPQTCCVAYGSVANEAPTALALIGEQNVVAELSYDVPKLRLLSFA